MFGLGFGNPKAKRNWCHLRVFERDQRNLANSSALYNLVLISHGRKKHFGIVGVYWFIDMQSVQFSHHFSSGMAQKVRVAWGGSDQANEKRMAVGVGQVEDV